MSPVLTPPASPDRAEADLAEARAILGRLLEAEERIGRVHLVMDDARRFLARQRQVLAESG